MWRACLPLAGRKLETIKAEIVLKLFEETMAVCTV